MPHPAEAIPSFYQYGEPHRAVDNRFVHIESLDDRSRPGAWRIRPHKHAALNQILHLTTGGGAMQADERAFSFVAPCLLIVPAGVVHGFEWHAESTGFVITLATSYLDDLTRRDEDLIPLFECARAADLGAEADADVARQAARLMRERGWAAPGHRAAADAWLLGIVVTAFRALGPAQDTAPAGRGHQAALVARLRQRVEARFRLRESIADHAAALGVSVGRLQAACARVAHQSPSEMIDQRALLEAKRSLLYSNLSVAEIAYSLGFIDPAYFSRFFVRHAAKSPRAFRGGSGT